jgi:hypothetical protein
MKPKNIILLVIIIAVVCAGIGYYYGYNSGLDRAAALLTK